MYGIILPRPALDVKPTPLWQTTFNSAVLVSDKLGQTVGYSSISGSAGGTIADSTLDILANATILQISLNAVGSLEFTLNGTLANSGWINLFVADAIFSRSAAAHSQASGRTSWSWTGATGTFTATQTGILLGMA